MKRSMIPRSNYSFSTFFGFGKAGNAAIMNIQESPKDLITPKESPVVDYGR